MSKLFKSKFLLGVMVVAFLVVGFAAATPVSADCTITQTLRVGSVGIEVQCLQGKIGVTADGKFGPMTMAAVKAFQAGKGLAADGVVGPMTRAALMGANPVVSNGCQSGWAFNPATGQPCTGGTTPPPASGELKGGAGDLTLTSTSTDVEDSLKEGEEDVNIFGVKAEADGSDIAITSVKVTFGNCEANDCDAAETTSENFTNYVDEVKVFLGDEEVGSADSSDFSKESGSPDEYSKTISLSNAIVRENEDAKLYVAVTGASSIDTDDLTADWAISLDTVRFNDATGAILTADTTDFEEDFSGAPVNDTFTFTDVTADDQIDLKSSSANPDDMSVTVEENTNSDETLALAFKLDVDDNSSDVSITSIPVTVTFGNLDVTNNATVDASDDSTSDSAAENVIDTVMVKIDGNDYEAELDSGSVSIVDGAGTATYIADIDSGDLTIDSGDVAEAKVYITFNDQDGNYNESATVEASVAKATIDAETDEDELAVTGSTTVTGGTLTLSLSNASVTVTDTSHTQNDAGTMGTFTFEVKVEADGADVDVDAASVVETVLGGTDTSYTSISIINLDGDATENGANDYTVTDGETNTFAITYTHDPDAAGAYYVRLDTIDGITVDETVGPESLVAA